MTGAEFHGVDIDLLADFVGGALDGTPESERVAALVAADPDWREAFELLAPGMAEVGALLGGLGAEPMPADVITRLDAALAAEPLPSTGPAESAGPAGTAGPAGFAESLTAAGSVSASRPTPDTESPSTAEPGLRVAEAAPGSGPESAPSTTGGAQAVPNRVLDLDERRRKRGNNRWVRLAAPIGIAAGAVAVAGYGLVGLSSGGGSEDAGSSKSVADAPAMAEAHPAATMASGTDYTLGSLGQLAQRSLKDESANPADASASGMTTMHAALGLERLQDPAALLECLDAIARENGGGVITAQSIDYARFGGAPALVVRFSAANGMWAWASGADCGLAGGDADTLGSVPVR